nr:MAG TPA: hypothetical protein [Crassvirales sp.]
MSFSLGETQTIQRAVSYWPYMIAFIRLPLHYLYRLRTVTVVWLV